MACLINWACWRRGWSAWGAPWPSRKPANGARCAMADWEIWVVVLVLGVATACTRSAFWLIGHRVTIPPRVQEMLRYAPTCALAAIIGPDLVLGQDGEVQLSLANPKLLGGLA